MRAQRRVARFRFKEGAGMRWSPVPKLSRMGWDEGWPPLPVLLDQSPVDKGVAGHVSTFYHTGRIEMIGVRGGVSPIYHTYFGSWIED